MRIAGHGRSWSVMDDDHNAVRRFINLVDTFYDRACAAVRVGGCGVGGDLYRGEMLAFGFPCAASRLIERQMFDDVHGAHRA